MLQGKDNLTRVIPNPGCYIFSSHTSPPPGRDGEYPSLADRTVWQQMKQLRLLRRQQRPNSGPTVRGV